MRFRHMALLALCLALAGCGKKGSKGVDTEAPPEDLPPREALAGQKRLLENPVPDGLRRGEQGLRKFAVTLSSPTGVSHPVNACLRTRRHPRPR